MPNVMWNLLGLMFIRLGIKTLIGNEQKQFCALLQIGYWFSEANPQEFIAVQNGAKLEFGPSQRKITQ